MSLSISNDYPVQFNNIDKIFAGKKGGDSIEINKGMLRGNGKDVKGYGEDSDITYLVTYVKLPKIGKDGELKEVKVGKEFSVERDADGHLTWKKGDKEIKLGSCRWEKFKHAVKMFFSSDYRVSYEIEVTKKIDVIRKAYAECLNKEDAAAKIISDQLAVEKEQADAAAKVIADQLAAEQEQVRLAQEAQEAQDAKDQRILNLNTNISTATAELDVLTQLSVDTQEDLDGKNDKKLEKETLLAELESFKLQTQLFPTKVTLFKDVVKIYNSFYISDEDKIKIAEAEQQFGSVATVELRTAIRTQLQNENTKLEQDRGVYGRMKAEDIQVEINYFTGLISGLENTLTATNNQITAKNNEIDALNAESLSVFFS